MYDEIDDLLGADEDNDDVYGATQRRIVALIQKRSKLEALLPVVGPGRQQKIMQKLERIDRVLEKSGYSASQGRIADALAASGLEGVGGLMFQAQAPPGLGRLLRLPFYPINATTGLTGLVITSAGAGLASQVNPVMIEVPAALNTSPGPHGLATPQVSWATLRLVGFETQQRKQTADGNVVPPVIVVSDLQIGGGANLFTHEDFADSTIYSADQPEFCGLRDYPLINSPNVATVTGQMVGAHVDTITWSCAILCEVLIDDNYGAHIPGPYSRKGALVRQGGSFVR